jgi:GDSL-like Lipase/Acylhydrolase family
MRLTMISRTLTSVAVLVCVGTTTSAAATPEAAVIKWSVVNNFGLLSGADAQTRYKTELLAHVACMRREYSPGSCANGRNTFGLTQQAFPVRFQPKTLTYEPQLLHPTAAESGDATDHVSIELSVPKALGTARCNWTIGAKTLTNAPCRGARAAVKLGDDTPVKVETRGKSPITADTTVNVRRVVIATFGDSFMSGEGNPHIRSQPQPVKAETWLEPRCHRSLLTSSAQAAFRWADANPQAYVAYYNFACSGSTAEIGLLGNYEGIMSSRMLDNLRGPGDEANHFRAAKMPSQIDQARQTLCAGKAKTCVAPDVVFLSIGINTLKFSETITDLGKRGCDAKCLDGLRDRTQAGLDELNGQGPGSLSTVYDTVTRTFAPKAAFAVEYPDPTRNEAGRFCDANALFPLLGKVGIGRIDAKENAWAHDKMLQPLNQSIAKQAAAVSGWAMIAGSSEATRRHGFCSKQRMFNSGQDAKGTSGTLHPNVAGHDAIGSLLLKTLASQLATAP